MRQIYRTLELMRAQGADREFAYEVAKAVSVYSPSFAMRIFVHESLFRSVVTMLGTKEQSAQWIDDIDNYRIYGCFAMVSKTKISSIDRQLSKLSLFLSIRQNWVIARHCVTLRRLRRLILPRTNSLSTRRTLLQQSGGLADQPRLLHTLLLFARLSSMASGSVTTGLWSRSVRRVRVI